jgi:hypothetical protein
MYGHKDWTELIQITGFCWLWIGTVKDSGYGQYKRSSIAHRVVYEALVGPIPEGLELDHLCKIKNCVNPDHLEPVTGQVNVARAKRVEIGERKVIEHDLVAERRAKRSQRTLS